MSYDQRVRLDAADSGTVYDCRHSASRRRPCPDYSCVFFNYSTTNKK